MVDECFDIEGHDVIIFHGFLKLECQLKGLNMANFARLSKKAAQSI